jgi:hypothetical protein
VKATSSNRSGDRARTDSDRHELIVRDEGAPSRGEPADLAIWPAFQGHNVTIAVAAAARATFATLSVLK